MSEPGHVLRVFARSGAGGNPLGVVQRQFDPGRMQAIATELGYSETIFLDSSTPPHVRIFTPQAELPFAGHPLVGAGWFIQQRGTADLIVCEAGPVRIWLAPPGSWIEVEGLHPVAPLSTDLWPGSRSVSEVAMPYPYLLIEVDDPTAVAAARATGPIGAYDAIFLWSRSGDRVRARFFAPGVGIDEDPATGSAAVALADLLRIRGENAGALTIDQGEEMGQPCRLQLEWEGSITRLGGDVIDDGEILIR